MMVNRHPWWQGTRGEWWVVAQVVLLAADAILPPAGPGVLSSKTAAGLALLGLFMLAAGATALGPSLSMLPRPLEGASLVRHGVYRWVRHPIYAGVILLAYGWALHRGDLLHLMLALGITGFFTAKASREEEFLRQRFPDYAQYRDRTWRFVPWIY
jgi:protein-S-isoprenylcysteine O-methyltransferase Ste14